MNKKKKENQDLVRPEESNRFYCIAQVSGLSNEKKELALTLHRDTITMDILNFDTIEKERRTIVSIEISNVQALKRLRAMLDLCIKTIEK